MTDKGADASMINCCAQSLPLSQPPPTFQRCGEQLDLASIALDEKDGPSSPGIYDGSTVASEASPGFRRSRCLDTLTVGQGLTQYAAGPRRSHCWHRRLARTKKPKAKKKTIVRQRQQKHNLFAKSRADLPQWRITPSAIRDKQPSQTAMNAS